MSASVFCKDVRTNETTMVKVEQPTKNTLKCEGVTYTIDPAFRATFKLENLVMVNPCKTGGLYTMFYVVNQYDGEVDETWHDMARA